MAIEPCVDSSRVIPVDFAVRRTPEWSFTNAIRTGDGPAGADGLRNLNTVPVAFRDQRLAGRSSTADSPEPARMPSVAPTCMGSSGPPGVGAVTVGLRPAKSNRSRPDGVRPQHQPKPGDELVGRVCLDDERE